VSASPTISDKARIVEALIFVAEGPLKPEQIMEVFSPEESVEEDGVREPGQDQPIPEEFKLEFTWDELQTILAELQEKYLGPEYVFELKNVGGGYQFYTKREYYPYLRQAAVFKNRKKLSRASLETLAIVAYRQPVTKTEVEFIRGVSCDYALRKLLDKNLVEIQGRADAPGRPLLYGTSSFFMEYFGINDVRDLPKLQELSVDEDEYQMQFKVFLEDKAGGSEAKKEDQDHEE
jgi:segregation and condensation protein B